MIRKQFLDIYPKSNIPARTAVSGVFCVLVLVVFLQTCLSSFYRFHPLRPAETIQAKRIHSDPLIRRGGITCDRSHPTYDLCSINGPTSLDPTTSTFYNLRPTATSATVEKIRPYPRKRENGTMSLVKELTITGSPGRPCEIRHKAHAFVFSAGGYTGNFFHDFNDGFIPLFITVNSVLPDTDDVILVVSDARDWWISKYAEILRAFSKHPIVNLDANNSTHCFTSATLGLISHRFMRINQNLISSAKSFIDFRRLLGKAFSRDQSLTGLSEPKPATRPRLVLITRTGNVGRVMLNQEKIIRSAEETGFEVITFEPTDKTRLTDAYGLINSSHAMMGVHGAAMTHMLFLRPGSVFLQVVPLGLEWVSEVCFETPARLMGLEYVEYTVGLDESSLVKKYGKDDLVIKDPMAFRGLNWSNMNVYLKEQDVRLDLVRVREYLKEMYKKAKRFMDKNG